MFQVTIDIDGQDLVTLHDKADVRINGDYDDLIKKEVIPLVLPTLALPDMVLSVTEFRSAEKVLGAEIVTQHGGFSVLLYPEDVDVGASSAIWDFVRQHGLRDLKRIEITSSVPE